MMGNDSGYMTTTAVTWLTNQPLSMSGWKVPQGLTLQYYWVFTCSTCSSLLLQGSEDYQMGAKKSKPPLKMITDKYFTTNINTHYMINKLECDYILRFQHYNAHFPTYNKASVTLTLEDSSRYLHGRYIESRFHPSKIWTYKNVLYHSKTTSCAIQCSGESVMRHRRCTDVWGKQESSERKQ